MRKVVVVILFFVSSFVFAQSAEELFDKANGLYKSEQYDEAVKVYKSIEELDVHSDDLYFNLANCYYKLNKIAPSIYYYEKALKLNPAHEDAKSNLVFANKMTIDAIEVLPKTVFQNFSDHVIYKLTYETWAKLSVSLSFIGALLFLLYHFSYTPRKKLIYFNGSILAAFLLVVSIAFSYKAYDKEVNTKSAIIFKQTTDIKNAPTFNSETVFKLHEGTKVVVLDQIDDWKKIKLADGKIGWIIADNIKEI